jgi:hypothetical protein
MRSRRFGYFSLAFGATWVIAMFLPTSRWPDLALGTLITGIIILSFSGIGLLGFPMKGNADPKNIAFGGIGLLLGAAFIYFVWRIST